MREKRRTAGMLAAAIITLILGTVPLGAAPVHLSEIHGGHRIHLASVTPWASVSITSTTPSRMQAQTDWGNMTMAPPVGFGSPLGSADRFDVEMRFRAMATGSAHNRAQILAQGGELHIVGADCSGVQTRNPDSDLQVSKRLIQPISGPAVVSQTVLFEILLENAGSSPITALRLQDEYELAYLSFVGADLDPDDTVDDGALDWSNLTDPAPHGFGHPLQPGQVATFIIGFQAQAATLPGQQTRNCLFAWYQQGGEPGHETAPLCADVSILQEPGPRVEVEKIVYDSNDPAHPGDTISVTFLVRNSGTTAFTNIALADSYDTRCLRFVPLGIPLIAPDDPADDGRLHWSHWVSLNYLAPGSSIQVIPSVHFQAKAGSDCDQTINRLEGVITDEHGDQAWDDDQEVVRIVGPKATSTPTATPPEGGVRRIYLPMLIKQFHELLARPPQ